MKYGVIGATGATGLELLKQLPPADTHVFVRDRNRLPQGHALTVTEGSLSDTKALQAWASSCDTVFFALGHGLSFRQIACNLGAASAYPQARFMSDAMAQIIAARPQRIIHCGAYGCRETREDLPSIFGKFFLPLLIKQSYEDHEWIETLLEKSSGISWVVARPGMLTNGPLTGTYRTVQRFSGQNTVHISRSDVAHFMIRSAKSEEFLRLCVGLGY